MNKTGSFLYLRSILRVNAELVVYSSTRHPRDWKHHLEVIGSFWETLLGGSRSYARPMPMKHLPLQLTQEHFERWLFLWQANCRAKKKPYGARE
jgi:truncated hemoglobin YjbI